MRTKPLVKRKNESDSESDTPLSSKVKAKGKKVKKDKGELAVKANGKAKAATPRVKKESGVKKEAGVSAPKPKREVGASALKPKKELVKKDAQIQTSKVKPVSVVKEIVDRKPLIKKDSTVSNASQNGSEASDDDYKWWLEQKGDDGPKWQTLEHSGVQFPPEYEPHNLPLIYKGTEIRMPPPVEEVATFFAAVLGTDHAVNKVFQKNFFDDFKEIASQHMPKHPFRDFKHCDFTRIRAHIDEQSAKRKAMTKAEKEVQKVLRLAQEE
ncbi:DNA topoisomerase 1, partial [Coemansia sp. RSA 2131]